MQLIKFEMSSEVYVEDDKSPFTIFCSHAANYTLSNKRFNAISKEGELVLHSPKEAINLGVPFLTRWHYGPRGSAITVWLDLDQVNFDQSYYFFDLTKAKFCG